MRTGLRWTVWIALVLAALLSVGAAYAHEGGDPEHGGRLFVENCAVCHGVDGKGRVGANLTDFPGISINAALIETIRQGIPGTRMPAWGQENGGPLTQNDIEDLAEYILVAFSGTEPLAPLPTYQPVPVTPIPGIPGDAQSGSVVFQANCTVCHGAQGQGGIGGKLAKSWPGNEPLAYVLKVVGDGIPGATMPAWLQANGGPLNAAEVADVSAYVLTLRPATGIATPAPAPEGPLSRGLSLALLGLVVLLFAGALLWYYRRA
ncbi:MAG: c-type cytochrome [Anaerolineales bacterium]|nr:c-type cytochrome [Anaerolineales bacterium]